MLWSVATMKIPETSIRPMGFTMAMVCLTIVGAVLYPIAMLCSWIANSLGSPYGAAMAKKGGTFVAAPFAIGILGLIGLLVICAYRGIAIGD
jgi:hypothetical protein